MRNTKAKTIRKLTRIFNEVIFNKDKEYDAKSSKENKEKNRQMYQSAKSQYNKVPSKGRALFVEFLRQTQQNYWENAKVTGGI